jgi:opacity protein-like surface antigen
MRNNSFMKLCLAVIFLFINGVMYGQLKERYTKGSLELQNDTTLDGFIKNDEVAKMNYKVSFKKTENAPGAAIYDTSTVKTVTLADGEIFDLLHVRGHYMTADVAVLGQLLVKGKASLYKVFFDGDYAYIIVNDGVANLLQKDKYDAASTSTEVTQYYFKNCLARALSGSTISNERIENMEFNETDFRKMIVEYNASKGSKSQVTADKEQAFHFAIAEAGGMVKNSNEHEVFFQFIYRMYLAKISRSTSLNIGLNYFKYRFAGTSGSGPSTVKKYLTYNLYSAPLQIQQNFLNKNIRPYIFAGFNVGYLKLVDQNGTSVITKGFQNNFGIGLLFGAGVEVDIYRGLLVKGEYRYENFAHLVLVGVGYNFSKQ